MKEAYQQKMEAQLKEWAAKIGELMAKAEKAKAEATIEYQRQIKELQAKQAVAQEKLEELRKAGEGAWEDLRAGLETAWDDLRSACNNAVARFKKTSSKRPTRRSKQRKRTSSSRRKTMSGKSNKRSMNSVRGSMNETKAEKVWPVGKTELNEVR